MTLLKVCKGEWQNCPKEQLEVLESYGYISKENGGYIPDITIFNMKFEDTIKNFYEEAGKTIDDLTDKAVSIFTDSLCFGIKIIDEDLPERIRNNPVQRSQACSEASHSRGYTVEQAVSDGWLKESSLKSLGAYISL
jgi:hypothetical protein